MRGVFMFVLLQCTFKVAFAASSPNFVMLFADDLGYGDTGFDGQATTCTPNLDRLAFGGKRLTSWYSGADVCSPSRASLMTGRAFVRSGIYPGVLGCDAQYGLPLNETLIPQVLKQAREPYRSKVIGKWHLGQREEYLPTQRGFDSYFGVPYSVDMGSVSEGPCLDPLCPYLPLLANNTVIEQPADLFSLSDSYAKEADMFIADAAASKDPFFLYMAFSHVHVTIPALKQYAGPRFNGTQPRGRFGDALAEMDWVVGEIYDSLVRNGVEEDTLILFASDNGPWRIEKLNGGSSGQFTGLYAALAYNYTDTGKGSTWEGGVRSPAFAYWKGKITPNSVSSEIVSSMDVLVTLANMAGAPLNSSIPLDGKDMTDILLHDDAKSQHEFLYLWRTRKPVTVSAVRHGPFKAHFITQSGYGLDPPVYHDPPLLFNVDQDLSEEYPLNPGDYVGVIAAVTEARANYMSSFDMAPPLTSYSNLEYAVCQQANKTKCFWPN